uniref:Uncharacterized protein n=1 Tax=Grammatophora oceanica TaxID=210454 RepID=A0A6U5IAK3_9STRA
MSEQHTIKVSALCVWELTSSSRPILFLFAVHHHGGQADRLHHRHDSKRRRIDTQPKKANVSRFQNIPVDTHRPYMKRASVLHVGRETDVREPKPPSKRYQEIQLPFHCTSCALEYTSHAIVLSCTFIR